MRLLCIALLATGVYAAELEDRTVSVTAQQTAVSAASQASVSVTITAPVASGLDEILGIVSEAGITATDLTDAYASYPASSTDWSFTHVVAIDKLNGALAALTTLKSRLAKAGSGMSLQFRVYSSGSSTDSCDYPSLVSDARRKADEMASAVGLRTGAIVALSDSSSQGAVIIPTAAIRTGDFSFSSFLLGSVYVNPPPAYRCSLTVQFKLVL